MGISIDPDETLAIAKKADDTIEDLLAEFKICDDAAEEAATLLDAEAPSVAASVRSVAAREGGDRTEPIAEAQAATWSVREGVGDFHRVGNEIKTGIEETAERVGDAAEWVGGRVGDGVEWVGDRVEDGTEWVGDRVGDIKDALTNQNSPKKIRRVMEKGS